MAPPKKLAQGQREVVPKDQPAEDGEKPETEETDYEEE